MSQILKEKIDSFDRQLQENPIEKIREALKEVNFNVQEELFKHQNLFDFSKHVLYSDNNKKAFKVNITRQERGYYAVESKIISLEEVELIKKQAEAFRETFLKAVSSEIQEHVDMIKKTEDKMTIEFLNQSLLERASYNNIEELEAIKIDPEFKFALKKDVIENEGFSKRMSTELKNKEVAERRRFKPTN